jgi:hypothetical protein
MSLIAVGYLSDGSLQFWMITAAGELRTRSQTRTGNNEWSSVSWSDFFNFLDPLLGAGPLPGAGGRLTDIYAMPDRLWARTDNGNVFLTSRDLNGRWTRWLDFGRLPAEFPPPPRETPEPFEGAVAQNPEQNLNPDNPLDPDQPPRTREDSGRRPGRPR